MINHADSLSTGNSLSRGHVVSDLHLFAHRSDGPKHLQMMSRLAQDADFLVLNGDIVDFKWTTLACSESTARVGVDWLASLVTAAPNCELFYVLGNHDRVAFFAKHLESLAAESPRFHWHPTHLRIGSCLFLHGDLMFDRTCPDPFGVAMRPTQRVRGATMNLGYRALISTRAHRMAHPFFHPRRCARRITRCLEQAHPDLADGLTDVYFGHTHRPFTDFRHGGLLFHNTGSSVRHLEGRLLTVEA